MPYLGETAALLTAVCWTGTSLLFSYVVRHIGSFRLNLVRLAFATTVFWILVLATSGPGWLGVADRHALGILALSGWIGLTVGDWAYFHSLGMLGPRLATLLVTLTPPMTALLGAAFLGEIPGPRGIAGMLITLAGVTWVVLERSAAPAPRGHRIRGVTLGAIGSLGQAIGYVMSNAGMAGGITPLQASAIRMTAGLAGVALLFARSRRAFEARTLLRTPRVLAALGIASLIGPVAGIWLSLVAVRHTQAGIASTIMAMVPVFVLPAVIFLHKERVSPRAIWGAVIAVAGVAILFWGKGVD